MPKKQLLSDQIRQLIDDADESRYQIAKDNGIDQAVMSRFMSGQRGLSLRSIDAIGNYLGWNITADAKERRKKGK